MKVTNLNVHIQSEKPPLTSDIPAVFAGALNEYWSANAKRGVFALTQEHTMPGEWLNWGPLLAGLLVPTGDYVGLCLDGQLPLDIPIELLGGIFTSGGAFQADLRAMGRKHPALQGRLSSNFTWISFHHVLDRSWIDSLWDRIDGKWLNAGADLLLTSYAVDMSSELPWDTASTVGSFGPTLARASGWLLPLDDNIGYLVGVIEGSPAYIAISSLATGT